MTKNFETRLDRFFGTLLNARVAMKRELEKGGPDGSDARNFLDLTHQLVIQLVVKHYQFSGIGLDNRVVKGEINFQELKELSAESKKNRDRLDSANLKKAV